MNKQSSMRTGANPLTCDSTKGGSPRYVVAHRKFCSRNSSQVPSNPGNSDPAKLHRLRLLTKRLRYTLELFRPCYGPGLETRLAALRRIQQSLGEVNDSAAAGRLLSESMSTASPQRARVLRYLEERAAVKAQEFRQDWAGVFDAPGQERWWTTYLARHARTPGRRA